MSSFGVDASSILNERSGGARADSVILEDKISDLLKGGARALEALQAPPFFKAKFAVLFIENLATQIFADLPNETAQISWSPNFHKRIEDAVSAFKSLFSLNSEVLQGCRELEPEFAFRYLLIRGLFYGRLPVMASDLKDSLAVFVNTPPQETEPRKHSTIFRGVYDAINYAIKYGPFFIVTGDTHETVLQDFLIPNGWVENQGGVVVPTSVAARNLVWLPRTGMELVRFDPAEEAFVRTMLKRGIKAEEIEPLRMILGRVFVDFEVAEYFSQPGRCYQNRPGKNPGLIEQRSSKEDGDYSLAFYPAGVLVADERPRFEADKGNAPFLERMVCRINGDLNQAGYGHIMAKRGGLSTIDLVTSDKGMALSELRQRFLKDRELLAFIGDKIALNGNDREGAEVADVSIQVGHEWDAQFFPPGGRTLLRSKRIAPEGAAAEFISTLTSIRRLGLAEIFGPDSHLKRNATAYYVPEASESKDASLPSHDRPLVRDLVDEAIELSQRMVEGGTPGEPSLEPLAERLKEVLYEIPEHDDLFVSEPLTHMEVLLLKRVVEGGSPVLASDLKDTLAVFDSSGVQWFPGARESVIGALRSAPYYLITGDSLPNLRDHFLLPARIVDRSNGSLVSSFPGIHNLHLITRTGLDRVIFNFSNGQLERSPLVEGIDSKDVELIADVLRNTATFYKCADFFRQFRHEESRKPGHIEIRGVEYGDRDASFAFFPAGVLVKDDRPRFRKEMTDTQIFRAMIGYVRRELKNLGLDNVLVQQGGISTIDLTNTTKGTALAQLKRQLLFPNEFFVYIGDTVTQSGNDGSTVGVADFTVQVGAERDESLMPPPGHFHFHSPIHAHDGGAARVIEFTMKARRLAALNLWIPPLAI